MARQGSVRGLSLLILSLATGLALGGSAAAAQPATAFTDHFPLDDCTFSNTGRNEYFSLHPGDTLHFKGESEDGEAVDLVITVLDKTRTVTLRTEDGEQRVKTRVIEERESVDGELAEVSRNYFARCAQTNDVYYFGEAVDIYEDGAIVSHEGSWLTGQGGALPGLVMPGTFLLGSRYFQENAPGVARDRAEHVAMGLNVHVPAGSFKDCVQIHETSALEPGAESTKVYCPDVGLVIDDEVQLVDFDVADDDD
jgi:hypothetical protein